MRLPDTFISHGKGYFSYLDTPIYIHKSKHGAYASYTVWSKGLVPHCTGIPHAGDEGMLEAVELALKYFKEEKRERRKCA